MVGGAGGIGYQVALSMFARVADEWRDIDRPAALNVVTSEDEWAWEGLRHAGMFYQDYYRPVSNAEEPLWESLLGAALDRLAGRLGAQPDPRIPASPADLPSSFPEPAFNRAAASRLRALDKLRQHERIVRAGWLWLAGRIEGVNPDRPDEPLEVCCPLLYAPVSISEAVRRTGDVRMHPLVEDPSAINGLGLLPLFNSGLIEGAGYLADRNAAYPARGAEIRVLIATAGQVASQMGLEFSETLGPIDALKRRSQPGLALVVGTGLFVDPLAALSPAGELMRRWSRVPGTDGSAFGRLYGAPEGHRIGAVVIEPSDPTSSVDDSQGPAVVDPEGAVAHQTRPLDADQRQLISLARTEPLVAVTGPPGTGKTHALCEVALDAVARGQSVLIATQSVFAIDVLARQLASIDGPIPVLFGGTESSRTFADRMTEMLASDAGHRMERRNLTAARAERDTGRKRINDDVVEQRQWMNSDEATARGLGRDAADVIDYQPTHGDLMAELLAAETRWYETNARLLRSGMLERAASRRRHRILRQIARATRSGRFQRRQLLADSDMGSLLDAAPLWLGSVHDINEVLPMAAGKFDLLILDEASQLDQITAASALLRASRAVVCGDTRQLRHEFYDGPYARSPDGAIDLAGDSIFDHVLGAGPLVALRRHYRSDPHLIEFSAQRFYDGGLWSATRHPGNDDADRIDVVVVGGQLDEAGVNQAEVRAVLSLLESCSADSIGVISPLAGQVSALTDAVIDAIPQSEIDARGIEVGSVPAFQGAEFDVVIASLALGNEATAEAWDEVNDPSLFNVMITRARRRMVVVTSNPEPPGLAGAYLRYAESGPSHTAPTVATPSVERHVHDPSEAGDQWTARVASALIDAGHTVETNYQVGGFAVDIVLRDVTSLDGRPVAVCCWPDGDHLERIALLHHMDWYVVYAFPQRWSGRLPRFAIELSRDLKPLTSAGPDADID